MMFRSSFLAVAAAGLVAVCFQAMAAVPTAATAKPTQATPQGVPPEIDTAFHAWDVDKSGTLSLQEFRNGWLVLRRASEMQARLREQFHKIDANKNDAIDANEYANLVLVKQAGKAAQPLSAFDANKDQRLEFSEYVELVRLMAPRSAVPANKTP